MLLPGTQLAGTPVMGLQTGTKLAQISTPLIDPANLAIVAYQVEGPLLSEHPSYLRIADVREIGQIGMIIDSADEFIGLDDVIKIKKLHDLHFKLIGLPVIDQTKHRLGKVEDYSIDADSFIIQQLHVKRSILQGFSETTALINRSQIIEINDEHIVVRTTAKKIEPVMEATRREYVNPFRSSSPQPDTTDLA
jgi:uncharacterized protein YrrD